jgi:archaellum component FlaF (FlaF/FlaG flagellin family)
MKKILKNYLKVCGLASAIVLVPACEQPVDPVIESVQETNETLQKHIWTLEDFRVELKDDDIPPPILFSLTEAEIAGGVYDLDDMVMDASDARKLRLQFTPEKEIVHVDEEFDFVFGDASTYFVFNDRSIRLSGPRNSLNYRYNYFGSSREMMFSLTEEQANKTIEEINQKLIKHIAKQTPDKIGDLVANILFNNEKVQQLINDQLVGLISGKIEFINDLDPDAIADSVSAQIILALQSVDWEGELTQLLKTELEKITNIDADAVSKQIGAAVAQKINEELTVSKIYDIVLPFIENITENPESSAESIANSL